MKGVLLRTVIALVEKQMAIPYEWRSMPEVMAEIPELRGVARGGLQQTLKNLIDDARSRVVARMGSDRGRPSPTECKDEGVGGYSGHRWRDGFCRFPGR